MSHSFGDLSLKCSSVLSITPQRLSILTTPSEDLPMTKAQKNSLLAKQSEQDRPLGDMEIPAWGHNLLDRDTGTL